MVTIEVQVNGGVAPLPIKVFIDNLDNLDDIRFTRTMSFTEHYALASGRYMLTVSGMNPDEGSTSIKLSGDFSKEPLPKSAQEATNRLYSILFYFEI